MAKSKPKSYKAPYDRNGNLMHYPETQWWYDEETQQRRDAPPEWRVPEPMKAVLVYEGYARGRSAAYFMWRHSTTGTRYPMFMTDLDAMLRARTIPIQGVHATWIECKRGSNYGIRVATAAEIEAAAYCRTPDSIAA